ncbi:MAG TPA: hypothetical protein PKZ53_12590, partial [Acidobacteriota bacterium]|nr:hypothetical protein [Acidobacteriota bacterium]
MDTLALNIRIRYATLILGLLITVVVTVWVYKTTDTPQPKDIVPVAAALIAMTALVYAAMSFHVNVQLNEIKLLQDKKQFSLSLISEWHKPDMAKLT